MEVQAAQPPENSERFTTRTYVEPSRITLGEYLEGWWKAGSWEGNTTCDYRVAIQNHVLVEND